MKTRVIDRNNVIHEVPVHARFLATIEGEAHWFVVADSLDGVGKRLVHEASGMSVARMIHEDAPGADWAHWGREHLDQLIAQRGAARVRSVLAGAKDLP